MLKSALCIDCGMEVTTNSFSTALICPQCLLNPPINPLKGALAESHKMKWAASFPAAAAHAEKLYGVGQPQQMPGLGLKFQPLEDAQQAYQNATALNDELLAELYEAKKVIAECEKTIKNLTDLSVSRMATVRRLQGLLKDSVRMVDDIPPSDNPSKGLTALRKWAGRAEAEVVSVDIAAAGDCYGCGGSSEGYDYFCPKCSSKWTSFGTATHKFASTESMVQEVKKLKELMDATVLPTLKDVWFPPKAPEASWSYLDYNSLEKKLYDNYFGYTGDFTAAKQEQQKPFTEESFAKLKAIAKECMGEVKFPAVELPYKLKWSDYATGPDPVKQVAVIGQALKDKSEIKEYGHDFVVLKERDPAPVSEGPHSIFGLWKPMKIKGIEDLKFEFRTHEPPTIYKHKHLYAEACYADGSPCPACDTFTKIDKGEKP